jgi:hypothetical protein
MREEEEREKFGSDMHCFYGGLRITGSGRGIFKPARLARKHQGPRNMEARKAKSMFGRHEGVAKQRLGPKRGSLWSGKIHNCQMMLQKLVKLLGADNEISGRVDSVGHELRVEGVGVATLECSG